jgi:hypothetical protein
MLEKAGATAVVPEILEPSLQLAAAVLTQVGGQGCWVCCACMLAGPRLPPNTEKASRAATSALQLRCMSFLSTMLLQLNMPEDEVADTIRTFRKSHLSELQVLAQIRFALLPRPAWC